MKKLFIIIIILPQLIYSCNRNKTEKNALADNMLLADEVRNIWNVKLENRDNPDWTAGLKKDDFLRKTFETAISGKVKVYGQSCWIGETEINGSYLYFGDEMKKTLSAEKIYGAMGWIENSMNFKEIESILFYEKWSFDPRKLKFHKTVKGWSPIRNIGDSLPNSIIFSVFQDDEIKGSQIAKSIFHKEYFGSAYSSGIDKMRFISFIIDGIKSGTIDAFDPIYLVDKSKRKFTPSELSKYIGQDLIGGLVNLDLGIILFEEDWYFDEKTLSIKKDVKSIAFIKDYYIENKGMSQKILFFIFPKE